MLARMSATEGTTKPRAAAAAAAAAAVRPGPIERADLVVVGAGIVGLAHAVHAVERGLSVVVVERDDAAVGASIRNFGHGCVTAQTGPALRCARRARADWLRLAGEAGYWAAESGTVVAARAEDELAVLREFAERAPLPVRLLDAGGVRALVPLDAPELLGGAYLAGDVRVNPREAVPAIAAHLARSGVRFLWRTSALGWADGRLLTSRGTVEAPRIVAAVGHDVDRLLPELAEDVGVRRCALQMLRVDSPGGRRFAPAVLTGLSLLRYSGFAACPSIPALRARFAATAPHLLEADLNLMFTQWPDGLLTIGDTHARAVTHPPFHDEALDSLLLAEIARLLGVPSLAVRERWRGVYATGPEEFLVHRPEPGVAVVAVTTGIGMTTAFGLAHEIVETLT